jgi:hypothetical protein
MKRSIPLRLTASPSVSTMKVCDVALRPIGHYAPKSP